MIFSYSHGQQHITFNFWDDRPNKNLDSKILKIFGRKTFLGHLKAVLGRKRLKNALFWAPEGALHIRQITYDY